jgi:hypothetical protein
VACGVAVFVIGAPAVAAEPTKDQCIDANEAAQTLVRAARLREAKRNLLVCVATSCPGPVREDCAQQLSQLEVKIPTLVFEAKDEGDRDLSAVRVTMDGQPLVAMLDGTAIPLDPGEHHFVFQSQGRRDETRTLVLREGEKNRRERIVLKAVESGTPTARITESASPLPPAQNANDGTTQRIVGLTVGGAGAAAVIVGSVFGIVAKTTFVHAQNTECGSNVKPSFADANACTAQGVHDGQTAHDQATVSTAAFVAGGALLAAGAYLYFSAPRAGAVSVAPSVGSHEAGLTMRGRW